MLKLRKVELLGFKSFCEKTHITFSGGGITCIVGPNGCGKSNIVDAISWVLGEQSHKLLRAERMADCIFNGTAKRPPLGLAQVSLTLVDPELAAAAAKVLENSSESATEGATATPETLEDVAEDTAAGHVAEAGVHREGEASGEEFAEDSKPRPKRRSERPVPHLKPGEVVVGRRLYRSGQSEYLINGHVARLRDVQELFMGIGLGPDSYAIIEQGRIGQILNSKPMDRRAIIEEAAGVTMYKTKRRLAEAKLEASKVNLTRVNDILVEVEKQLASLKRQASKARRYAELREEMRGLLRALLASKAHHLDTEAERIARLIRELAEAEAKAATELHRQQAEHERIKARVYELDAEIRREQNRLGQTALELDRAENRIVFNREKATQTDARAARLVGELHEAELHAKELRRRLEAHHVGVEALELEAGRVESLLRDVTGCAAASEEEQAALEARASEFREATIRCGENAVRYQTEAAQAEEAAARLAAANRECETALRHLGAEFAARAERAAEAELEHGKQDKLARELSEAVQEGQIRLAELQRKVQETNEQFDRAREELSAARARASSLEKILHDRAYSADAVQKLFSANGQGGTRGFGAVGLLADYAEVEERYEAVLEQFLRDEMEYIVVETFDQARAGISLLRNEGGGRATFFVDSLGEQHLDPCPDASLEPAPVGVMARLSDLISFREPLGSRAKRYITKLQLAYLVASAGAAEGLARQHPSLHFLTPEGTCYHGRVVTGGRAGEAGPLALKRELRRQEAATSRLERIAAVAQADLVQLEKEDKAAQASLSAFQAQHVEAQKALVARQLQLEQARAEMERLSSQLKTARGEAEKIFAEANSARARAARTAELHTQALASRGRAEQEARRAGERLATIRNELQLHHEQLAARREELATMTERLASAEALEEQISQESAKARQRCSTLIEQQEQLKREKAELEVSVAEWKSQAETLRAQKSRLEERKLQREQEWNTERNRAAELEGSLRACRSALDELRAARSQHEIEKARNDSDREHLRQTCVAELNAQPEELIAERTAISTGEEFAAAEASYNEMKARVEAMGPVNMMALEEYKECEERESFLRRERDDLLASIENTQLAIRELDEVSRQKFEEAFAAINRQFAVAFQALFGGGTGEMRLAEPDSSGEAGIDIVAQPPGKRLQNVLLLSGGEKALAALALLIAVFRYQPSPFCILDEVDAPLDEANVGRFTKMLNEMGQETQFIVVTHNRKTMEMGSVLYGVTMQEPGVSKLVSVRWDNAAEEKAATHVAA